MGETLHFLVTRTFTGSINEERSAFGLTSPKRQIQEIHPDYDNRNPDHPVGNIPADICLFLDLLSHRTADRADDDERDAHADGVDKDGENALHRGLGESDVGEDYDEHGRSPPDGDGAKGEAEEEGAGDCVGDRGTEPGEDALYGRFVEVEKLEAHEDEEDAANAPGNGAV